MKNNFYKTIIIIVSLVLSSFTFHSDTKNKEFQNTYAVVIGIADYKYQNTASDLTWTVNDADKFIKFLQSNKGGNVPNENIYYFKDSKAKKANIIKYAEELYKKAGPNDRVIFFWSGHGCKGAFIPYDGYFNEKENKIYNILYYKDLKEIMRAANSNVKIIFADACHSGSLKESSTIKMERKAHALEETKEIDNNSEVAIMVASNADEVSMEYSTLKQGVFSYFLIKGLEGQADANNDKKVTIKELHDYVYKEVKSYNPKQSPVTFGKFDKEMIVSTIN